MNNLKKYLALFLALAMILPLIPMLEMPTYAALASTGTTGTCTWSLNGTKLTISPTDGVSGEMAKYGGNESPFTAANITELEIKEGVKNVSTYAFFKCAKLTSVSLPSTVTTIAGDSFRGCSLLPEIDLTYVTSIGGEAFRGCTSLSRVTTGSNLQTVGNGTFMNCTSLTDINFGNSVTSIGSGIFEGCTKLTSVGFGSGLSSIGINAFLGCEALSSITISGNNTFKVENNCILEKSTGSTTFDLLYLNFAGAEVTIPESVVKVCAFAFANRTNVTKVIVSKNVREIAKNAFQACSSLATFEVDPNNEVFKSENGYLLNKLGDTLILGAKNAQTIPNSVTTIGKFAFAGRSEITSVTIPESVVKIDSHAFNDCTSLSTIVLPANGNLTTIETGAFAGCTGLSSVTIPNKVTKIGRGVFSGCTSLEQLSVCANNTVYRSANNCILSKDGTTLIYGCKGSTVPETITEIGDYAFDSCSGLTSFTIPNGVTRIGDFAFAGCSELTTVVISNSVSEIGTRAFFGCSKLSSVDLPDGDVKLGSHLFGECKALRSLILPEGMTKIDPWTFSYCTALQTVVIPKNVTSIGEAAFLNCKALTSVVLPEGIETIAYGAFYGCTGLTNVWFCGTAEPTSVSTFKNSEYLAATIHHIDDACDSSCNDDACGATSSVVGHIYTNDCDATCNLCGQERGTSAAHKYADVCDDDCENCGAIRTAPHFYSSDCDEICGLCNKTRTATALHTYSSDCDELCDHCDKTRAATALHTYSSNCDENCDRCGKVRMVTAFLHTYANSCDSDCNLCGTTRAVVHHYTAACETECERCSSVRTAPEKHSYKYNSENGTVVCTTCKRSVSYSGMTGECFYHLEGTTLTVYGNGKMGYGIPWGTDITSVRIMEGVTQIGIRTFEDCKNLTSVVIPDGVTVIGRFAFAGCTALSDVTLPASVKEIFSDAFDECKSLQDIWFKGTSSQAETIVWKETEITEDSVINGSGTTLRTEPLTSFYPGTENDSESESGLSTATWHYTSINSINFSLHASINANLYANIDSAQSAQSIAMRFTMNGKEIVVHAAEISNGTYMFVYKGIAPQCMNDTITAELIIDGEIWDVKSFSVRTYCDDVFSSSPMDLNCNEVTYESLKTMLLDLLNYGSMAQQYKGYKTNSLANAGLKDAETALGAIEQKEWNNSLSSEWNKELGASDGVNRFKSANVWFDSENRLYFTFAASDITETNFFVRILDTVTGEYHDYTRSQFDVISDGVYGVFSEPISVCNFDHRFTITLYSLNVDGEGGKIETPLQTLSNYGINSYIYAMQNKQHASGNLTNMALLARACYCYGVSAKIYKGLM